MYLESEILQPWSASTQLLVRVPSCLVLGQFKWERALNCQKLGCWTPVTDSLPIPLFMWAQPYDPKTCSKPPLPTCCIEGKLCLHWIFGRCTQTAHCIAYVRTYTGLITMLWCVCTIWVSEYVHILKDTCALTIPHFPFSAPGNHLFYYFYNFPFFFFFRVLCNCEFVAFSDWRLSLSDVAKISSVIF